MLNGAFVAFAVAIFSGNPYWGLAAGVVLGAVLGLIHALLTVTLGCNQVVAALGENMFAVGVTATLNQVLFGVSSTLAQCETLPTIPIPGLCELGAVGEVLFNQNILFYIAVLMIPITLIVFFRTTAGLKIRAIGEHPKTADTLGVNVTRVRYATVVVSGIFASLGGAAMTVGNLSFFQEGMIAGRGFIAFCAVVFGRYMPIGTLIGSVLFGVMDALQLRLQAMGFDICYYVFLMIPYAVSIVTLVFFGGKAFVPRAQGLHYVRNER